MLYTVNHLEAAMIFGALMTSLLICPWAKESEKKKEREREKQTGVEGGRK